MARSKSTIWWLPWVTLEIKPTFGGRARVTGMYGHVRSGRALRDGLDDRRGDVPIGVVVRAPELRQRRDVERWRARGYGLDYAAALSVQAHRMKRASLLVQPRAPMIQRQPSVKTPKKPKPAPTATPQSIIARGSHNPHHQQQRSVGSESAWWGVGFEQKGLTDVTKEEDSETHP